MASVDRAGLRRYNEAMDRYEWEKMPPKVREKYLEIQRAIPPEKKLRIAIEHSMCVREMMRAGIRAQHPGITEEEVRRELIRRTLPPEIVEKVYGWKGYSSKVEDERETGRKYHERLNHILGKGIRRIPAR